MRDIDSDSRSLLSQVNLTPIRTQGMRDDIEKMLPIIKEAYDKCAEYTDEWQFDVRPSLWHKDTMMREEVYNLSYISSVVEERLKEAYAILLAGLGENK